MTLSAKESREKNMVEAMHVAKQVAIDSFTPASRVLIEKAYGSPRGTRVRTELDILMSSSRRGVYRFTSRGLSLTERVALNLVAEFLKLYHQKYQEHFSRIVARRRSGRG